MGPEVAAVWILMNWSAVGQARGDLFRASRPVSRHATIAECEAAMKEVLSENYGLFSCIPGFFRERPSSKPKTLPKELLRKETVINGETCYGDDYFCRRAPRPSNEK
jgi:hypothetical protein